VVHDPSESNATRQFGQVLRFRLRRGAPVPLRRAPAIAPGGDPDEPIDDLAQYEQEDGEIDYRHRMVMNVIAVVIVSFLVGVGVWIADTIADMEKIQDCAMQGRQNCAPIEIPLPAQRKS
jgi:hypothetical protein